MHIGLSIPACTVRVRVKVRVSVGVRVGVEIALLRLEKHHYSSAVVTAILF